MPLDNFSNLKGEIRALVNNDDLSESVLDTCIRVCENVMFVTGAQGDSMNILRVREMITSSSLAVPTMTRILALPADFLDIRSIRITSNSAPYEIQQKDPISINVCAQPGRPRYFTVTNQIEFDRTGDSAYPIDLVYYAQPTLLSSGNATNAILTKFPSIYLYGACAQAHMYSGEEDKARLYNEQFVSMIRGANDQDKKGRYKPGQSVSIIANTP